jgi:hypothetical protein
MPSIRQSEHPFAALKNDRRDSQGIFSNTTSGQCPPEHGVEGEKSQQGLSRTTS